MVGSVHMDIQRDGEGLKKMKKCRFCNDMLPDDLRLFQSHCRIAHPAEYKAIQDMLQDIEPKLWPLERDLQERKHSRHAGYQILDA
jgi:hypothetical protein